MNFDVSYARTHFPAFADPDLAGWSFFENAGGSFACQQTIDALDRYYRKTKVQPYAPYPVSTEAGTAMDASRQRWAGALGVSSGEVQFGPSTSMNTYVLASAFREVLGPGDVVIVTNQDHEANTGAIRRAASGAGADVIEWRVDPSTGLLDVDVLSELLTPATKLVTVPHCSNIVGQENDIAAIASLAHDVGARLIVDAVSFAPHSLPDVAALDADVYLFSLYKTYSVHQGLMVTRNGILDELPNQGHFFNESIGTKRLTPAGPDHAQEAAAGAVLDYVDDLYRHHGGTESKTRAAVADVSARWRDQEASFLPSVLELLEASPAVRLLGPAKLGLGGLHRCPTVAFVPLNAEPAAIEAALIERRIMCSAGHFYAYRLLEGLDVDPERGVVRLSWVHYTDAEDIERLISALGDVVG